jgi:hypothetical protein
MAVGVNAAVFGVLNALILRPLNVPRPESLYVLERANDLNPPESYANYVDLRDRSRSFESLAAFAFAQGGFNSGGDPVRVWYYDVSGNYFDALGVRPHLGRVTHPSDEHGPGSAPYTIISTWAEVKLFRGRDRSSWLSLAGGDSCIDAHRDVPARSRPW